MVVVLVVAAVIVAVAVIVTVTVAMSLAGRLLVHRTHVKEAGAGAEAEIRTRAVLITASLASLHRGHGQSFGLNLGEAEGLCFGLPVCRVLVVLLLLLVRSAFLLGDTTCTSYSAMRLLLLLSVLLLLLFPVSLSLSLSLFRSLFFCAARSHDVARHACHMVQLHLFRLLQLVHLRQLLHQ
mgnify:CR=1 FL=1